MLARLGGRAVVVAFEHPALVEGAAEGADGGAQVLEGLEAFDPEDLFLDDAEEALDAAVGLGLVVVGRRASDAEVIDLGLVVVAAKARPPVVAQRQPSGVCPMKCVWSW